MTHIADLNTEREIKAKKFLQLPSR